MGLSPWKCWRLWQRQMSPLSEAGPSESPWSHASCRSWLPFLLHEQSLEPQEEGSGGPGWKHHDDCEHKRSRQWQKLNWIRLNHTIKGFMQLHFCISVTPFLHFWNVYQHLWNVYQQKDPTDLLWCKNVTVTHRWVQLTCFDAKNVTVTHRGVQLTCFDAKNVTVTHGGAPTDLLDV